MDNIYIRIISFRNSKEIEKSIVNDFTNILITLGAIDIIFSSLGRYEKTEGGIMNLNFRIPKNNREILKEKFSDTWHNDVADYSWASIFNKDIHFLWLTNN